MGHHRAGDVTSKTGKLAATSLSLARPASPTALPADGSSLAAERNPLLERMSDAYIALDQEWRCTYINGAAERLLRRPRAALLGVRLWDALPKWCAASSRTELERAMRERAEVAFEAGSRSSRRFTVRAYPDAETSGLTIYLQAHPERPARRDEVHLTIERKQAEDAVAHLAAIVASADDAIVSKTLDGIVTSWNASAERIFGYTASEMIGQSIRRIIPPDRQEEEDRILAHLRAGERVEHFETVRLTKDGRPLDVSLTISPVRDSTGAIIGASKIAHDITERKRLERLLTESEAHFGSLFNQAGSGMVQADATGRMTLVNRRWCQMLGYTEAELLQMNIADITDPASLAPTLEAVGRLAAGGPNFVIEKNYRRKDGSLLPANSSVCALRDPDGTYQGLVAMVLDVTERKRAQEAVRESEERFRTLADNIPTLAWMAYPDGRIFWYNHRWYEYTGTTPESQEGWGWQSVHDPDMLPEVLERWQHSIATGEPFEMVFPLKGADGVFRPFLTRITPVKDEHGQVARWFGTNTDVTEQLATEEALRAANHRMDQFLHTATHELKTPITSLQASLQLGERRIQRLLATLARQPEPPDHHHDQRDATNTTLPPRASAAGESEREATRAALQSVAHILEHNQRQVHRLTRLVNDLVDAARIQAGKLEIRPAPADLTEIVRDAVTEQRTVRPDRTIHLILPAEKRSLPVQADAVRVGQVVTNYLTNALKYSSADRPVKVTLDTGSAEGIARVAVCDEGPGIPAEELPRVWERGHRVPGIEQFGEGVGLGLGLHISREIIERHGGQVGVESAPGHGSTFWFTLPLAPSDA